MLTLDEIADRLKGIRLERAAADTGLHFNTIRRYRDRQVTHPPVETVRILSDYLASEEAA